MNCQKCGKENDNTAKFCSGCGSVLPKILQDASIPHSGNTATDHPEEFYMAMVGPKNQDYYMRHFARFNSSDRAVIAWNWPAFFITFYWFLYRKMWLNALLYFFLPYFVMISIGIAAAIAGKSADTVITIGYFLYLAGIFLLLPMYANAIYYAHCKKKISETRSSSHDAQRQLGELSGKGGTSYVVLLVLVPLLIAIIGILAAIAIPTYQEYATRARMSQAAAIGSNAAESVANYYYQHQQAPSSMAQAGFTEPLPPFIKNVGIDSQSSIVTVTMATGTVDGKTLLMIPSLDENNKVSWKCMSQDIQDKLLPQQCRQPK